MKSILPLSLMIASMALISCDQKPTNPIESIKALTYPESNRDTIVDERFGVKFEDPYRWLEDDNAPETMAWVDAQNQVTRSYLDSIPERMAIKKRLTALQDFEKVGAPYRVGQYTFFNKNSGLQNQSVTYVKTKGSNRERTFIDPNKLSKDGTVTMSLIGADKAHKLMAVSRSEAGSDWSEIRVMDIASGKETGDRLEWVKFGGASWYKQGFFYSRYPEPKAGDELSAANTFHQVYYHKIGEDQSKDELVYQNLNAPNLYHWVQVSEDDKYLFLYASTGTDGYETYFKSLDDQDGDFQPIYTGFEHKNSVVDHIDGKFLVRTDVGASRYRLVAIDPSNTSEESWEEIIPEGEHLLENITTGGGKLFAHYLQDASSVVYQCDYDGKNGRRIEFPAAVGSVYGLSGEKDEQQLYYTFTSFTFPSSIYAYDLETGQSELYFRPELKFNPEDYEAKQVKFISKDGTAVPLFIVHKKGLELDGKRPTLLYGYGGFNVNLTPSFSINNIVLLENGGVYAMANLRGGGEYGEEWHQAGMLDKKQNVFDDFIGAAKHLIKEGYTNSEKLAIEGGSNGGLLVGAAMTQAPDLFAVAFPRVGVMDMMRYHLFTVGWGWIPEYGCADSSKTQREYLLAYSPLHNLKEGVNYPATMVTTADHDDRVVPAHSFKYAAQLQHAHQGEEPVMIRIEKRAGHGAGKPISKAIDERADIWAFMFANMDQELIYE